MMPHYSSTKDLLQIVKDQKNGKAVGVYSICSAHPFVIEAAMQQSLHDGSSLQIESTCNQVNQFGGYTGMKPMDFVNFVHKIASTVGFPLEKLILGGDHLGPNPWQKESAGVALEKSKQILHDYVNAGYSKIHIDTSMACGDDPKDGISADVIARRAADLCLVAEIASDKMNPPVYIIGTEVPPPGGEKDAGAKIRVTDPTFARDTIDLFHFEFDKRGLQGAWQRVIGLVVQPGVDFGDQLIHDYDREAAKSLTRMIESVPGIVFEAHSTDYQKPVALRQLVEDHFAIIKVGPELTFAMREAIFALSFIAREMGLSFQSDVIETAEQLMVSDPQYWKAYYFGTEQQLKYARRYSLSDRIRYYWTYPELKNAVDQLMQGLSVHPVPLALISQYMPDLYCQVREGTLRTDPKNLIKAHISTVIRKYSNACLAGN